MSIFSTIDEPEWPEILRAVQDSLAQRIHTSLPGIVKSYDSATQTAEIQLAVQLRGNNVPPLPEVPVAWPGGAAGFLHAPLSAGDSVLVVFTEEDFSGWHDTGSVSAPRVLARHGLHAVAIPGLRRPAAALSVTGGHVTLGATSELRLGSDAATAFVAMANLVDAKLNQLRDAIATAAQGETSASGLGGMNLLAAALVILPAPAPATPLSWPLGSVASTKVKAE
jgi:protein gp138